MHGLIIVLLLWAMHIYIFLFRLAGQKPTRLHAATGPSAPPATAVPPTREFRSSRSARRPAKSMLQGVDIEFVF